ncbi:MAG: extradiol dioxygenase [Magnetovibrio sp.]|nr:extradiol dioxygenase [Magnetovibrio sp.]
MGSVREAAVAGTFYPYTTNELRSGIEKFLLGKKTTKILKPKAIIAPHAGYVYSGSVAASAYVHLETIAHNISRVILLGPCHRVPVRGLAISSADFFQTPLGDIPVDKRVQQKILSLPQVQLCDAAHAMEHSLEVHLPFLQEILGNFLLVPIVVGQAKPSVVASVLDQLWGGPETFIVVSSDLSHYLDYKTALDIDRQTCSAIEQMAPEKIRDHGACGRYPIGGLLHIAKARGLKVKTVDLRNSGDTAGPKNKVVGYGAWVFFENRLTDKRRVMKRQRRPATSNRRMQASTNTQKADHFCSETKDMLEEHGETLVRLAAKSILIGLKKGTLASLDISSFPMRLRQKGASFVTLYLTGNLRGCIGSLQMHQPLVADIVNNAFKAAFQDPRFKRVSVSEVKNLEISISLLSSHIPFRINDQLDLLKQLQPKKDGLIIQDGAHRALFLPTVWEQIPEPEQFLLHLKKKAGMNPDQWSNNFKAWRFVTEEVTSSELSLSGSLWKK